MRARLLAPWLAPAIAFAGACGQPPTTSAPTPSIAPAPSTTPPTTASMPSTTASASSAASTLASASASPAEPPKPPAPRLSTTHLWSRILERPSWSAATIGWVRAGSRIERAATKTEQPGCATGWYSVKPGGFVCDGAEGVTTDLDDPAVAAAARYPPDLASALPYGYGTSESAPFYARIPTAAEMKQAEGDVAAHLKEWAARSDGPDATSRPPRTALPLAAVPEFLRDHAQAPSLLERSLGKQLTAGSAWSTMGLAFVAEFEAEGRDWYLTTEQLLVPADRMRAVRLSDFHGIELAKPGEVGEHLPIAWVRAHEPVKVLRLEGDRVVDAELTLPFRSHVAIADAALTLKGQRYLELTAPPTSWPKERWLVQASDVTRVDAEGAVPSGVGANDAWVDVSLRDQTLVYYEGTHPTFATLISSGFGADHGTPMGLWRIYAKHVSSRMERAGKPVEKPGDTYDPPYRLDDVPWVQYYSGPYALHTSYWHDEFGQPHSHGCINLSPVDARTIFERTTPSVPSGWHGVVAGYAGAGAGTWVRIRW